MQVKFSSDVYSFGLLLLQILTGRSLDGDVPIQEFMENALARGCDFFIDKDAGPWPLFHALDFGRVALKCAAFRSLDRPDLEKEVLPDLEWLYAEAQEQQSAASAQGPLISNQSNNDIRNHDNHVCVVCMDKPVTHAFVPCGHRCVCEDDAKILMTHMRQCPVCRTPAVQAIQIY